jgi:hypothetical protein
MGFTPVSFMALTKRLKQHPLPRDQIKKCEQMGCALCTHFSSAYSTPVRYCTHLLDIAKAGASHLIIS